MEEEEQAGACRDWWRAGTDPERAGSRREDRVLAERSHVLVPVVIGRVPQVVDVVEDGKLHVGMDAVDQRHAAIGEREDHGVLVVHVAGTEHASARLVELEALAVPSHSMGADPPRTVRRQPGVRHDEVIPGVVSHPLHAGVFEAEALFRDSEHVSELVLEAVDRGEHHDVGHVVLKPRATRFAQAVSLAHGPHEQVVATLVVDQAGIEQRPVARERAGFQDRPGRQAAHAAQALSRAVAAIPHEDLLKPSDASATRVPSSG